MNAAKQAAWMFVALIGLACSGWYYASAPTVFTLNEQALSTTVDIVIRQLIVHQFDANGQLAHYLHTPLMQHTPFNNTHWLKNPHIKIAQKNQPPWDIRAEHATALHNGKQITFNKHVLIHQKKDAHTQESTLATEEITYFPENKLATTPKLVEFTQAGNVMKSTGMKAWLAENRVQLLSNAQGTYVPEHG